MRQLFQATRCTAVPQRETSRKVALAVLLIVCGLHVTLPAQTDSSWVVPVRVQIDTLVFNMSFGVAANATDGFDPGIDATAPPAAFSPHTFFIIPVLPNSLWTDMRQPGSAISWLLRTFNSAGKVISVSWDSSQLPLNSTLMLADSVDMLATGSTSVVGDVALQIQFSQTPVSVAETALDRRPTSLRITPFPNPFHHSTTFRIERSQAAPLTVRLYNIIGQQIRIFPIAHGLQNEISLRWDGTDAQGVPVPAGVYFYEIRSNRSIVRGRIFRMR